jgi:hypothetical protein
MNDIAGAAMLAHEGDGVRLEYIVVQDGFRSWPVNARGRHGVMAVLVRC